MANPIQNLESRWHDLSYAHCEGEPNPVITPYKKVDAINLYEGNGLTINKRLVTLKDGTQYFVTSSDFTRPRRVDHGLEGLGHYEGVAYTTWPEGLYPERLKVLGDIGITGSVFSIPDNVGKWISYTDNVNNYLSMTNNEAWEHDRDPEVALYSGISQGAMNGTGFVALAPEHDINVLAAHLNVLCLPDGITLKDAKYIPGHLMETLTKFPNELFAFVSLLQMDSEKREKLYPTMDIRRKKALIVQLQMLRSLLSGDTGRYARQMGEDMPIYAELNDGDSLSRAKRWVNGYIGDRPNVKIKRRRHGSHADCISEIAQSNWAQFQTAVAEQLTHHPEIRNDPKTAGAKLLGLLEIHNPKYTKAGEQLAI